MEIVELGGENIIGMNFTWEFVKSGENAIYWSVVKVEREVESVGVEELVLEF